jgi:ABC-type nitrate/sulfonate/bicarbonate transport system substrate-binding protein
VTRAADPTTSGSDRASLRVRVFPGVQNLALFAGQAKGVFARHGLEVDLQLTADSEGLRRGLAAGEFEIAHAAVDNAVAMVETAGVDVVVVMGGSNGLNELFVQPGITAVPELRGKTVIVDAPDTAYALQLRKILLMHGLVSGRDYAVEPVGGTPRRLAAMRAREEYAGTLLSPPYSILAERAGLRSLGAAATMVGPYQAISGFVMRPWARANGATLERYIRAHVEALRWALVPANRDEVVALLARGLDIPMDVAATTYARCVDPAGGLTPDARLDLAAFRSVLSLRAEVEGYRDGRVPPVDRYYDPRYYERALVGAAL